MSIRMVSAYKQDMPDGSTLINLTREIDEQDGSIRVDKYQFPYEIFDIRAAEYGIDRNEDFRELVDIVMYEVELTNAETSLLWDMPTIEDARREYCRSVAAVKWTHDGIGEPPGEQDSMVREWLNQNCSNDRELRELIASQRDVNREITAKRRERPIDPTSVDSARLMKARVRDQLRGNITP